MKTTIRKLTFTLPFLLAAGLSAGLLALMFHTASGVASFQMGAPLSSHILHVDVDAAGSATGLSWTDAYTNLQDALADAATTAPTTTVEIWVAEGVYYPDEGAEQVDDVISSTYQLADSVEIYGGFAATETLRSQRDWEAHVTVLSGDLEQNDTTDAHGVVNDTSNIVGSNAYHVLTGSGVTSTARLDGFTITAGRADGNFTDSCGPACGGGIYNDGGSPALANGSFSGNVSAYYGGGMYNDDSSPTLTNVSFSGNRAGRDGGGMLNFHSSPTLTNVSFSGNEAGRDGGGMFNFYDSNPTLTDVSFSGNAAYQGGGMFSTEGSSPTLTNVSFSGNASFNGGGMYNSFNNPKLDNVTFSGNASINGGGMYNSSSSPAIRNSILWGNQDGTGTLASAQIHNSLSTPVISHTLVIGSGGSGGGWDVTLGTDGGGNLDANPLFVAPVDPNDAPTTEGNLRLHPGSPAIDAGDDSYVTTSTDLDGYPRIVGSAVDMGAYERQTIDLTMYLPLIVR